MFRAKQSPMAVAGSRILILTPQPPYPPHQGTAIRNWHLVKYLAARHRVDLLTFAPASVATLFDSQPLQRICRRVTILPSPQRSLRHRLVDLAMGRPDMARRLHSRAFAATMARQLREAAEADDPYTIIQAEGIEMAPYLLRLSADGRSYRRIYDAHNAEALLQCRNFLTDVRRPRRWVAAAYSLLQTRRLARLEAAVLHASEHILAVSEADAAALRALEPKCRPLVVRNGVDTAFYDPDGSAAHAAVPLPGAPARLVFSGKLDYRPNIEACEWLIEVVMPRVWAAHPSLQVLLVGRDPARRVAALASARVTVTGQVPDIRPYMRAATVYVAPLRVGGGTRIKLLEALAMGCAIVCTPQGSEGLELQDTAVLADTASEFASAIIALLSDPARRTCLGRAARQLATDRYDWASILPALDPIYA